MLNVECVADMRLHRDISCYSILQGDGSMVFAVLSGGAPVCLSLQGERIWR